MVCYTELSWKSSSETVWNRTSTFKKYFAGDLTNHLSSSLMAATDAINKLNSLAWEYYQLSLIVNRCLTSTYGGAAIVPSVVGPHIQTGPEAASSSADWSEPLWFGHKCTAWSLARWICDTKWLNDLANPAAPKVNTCQDISLKFTNGILTVGRNVGDWQGRLAWSSGNNVFLHQCRQWQPARYFSSDQSGWRTYHTGVFGATVANLKEVVLLSPYSRFSLLFCEAVLLLLQLIPCYQTHVIPCNIMSLCARCSSAVAFDSLVFHTAPCQSYG